MTRGTTQKDPTPPDGIMNWLIGPMGHSPGPLWRAGHLESNGAQPGKQLTPDSPLTTRPRRLSPPPPLRPAAAGQARPQTPDRLRIPVLDSKQQYILLRRGKQQEISPAGRPVQRRNKREDREKDRNKHTSRQEGWGHLLTPSDDTGLEGWGHLLTSELLGEQNLQIPHIEKFQIFRNPKYCKIQL